MKVDFNEVFTLQEDFTREIDTVNGKFKIQIVRAFLIVIFLDLMIEIYITFFLNCKVTIIYQYYYFFYRKLLYTYFL